MADTKKQMAALKELAEKMGFDLTKKVAPKKMRGGGATKAPKRMRGGGATKAPRRMRGGGSTIPKKMMRGGGAAKAVSPRKRMAMGMESGGVAGIKPPKNLKSPKNAASLKRLQKVKK